MFLVAWCQRKLSVQGCLHGDRDFSVGFSDPVLKPLPRLRYADGVQYVIIGATTITTPRVAVF